LLIAALALASACRPGLPAAVDVYERITGGAGAEARLPLVVALHGYGGSPENIAHIVDGLPVAVRLVAPHGALPAFSGWGWFSIDAPLGSAQNGANVRTAADAVLTTVRRLTRTRPTCGRPIVLGFSQGAILSYALATMAPTELAAAFPLAGLLPGSLWPDHAPPQSAPIVAFHGDADERVPFASDQQTQQALIARGFAVELRTYPSVAHTIPPAMQSDLHRELERVIREQGCAR
jgi:phospholipase/carboxylesterase